jgi:hypothetical protein
MYDDDTDDHWGFENPLSPLSNTFRATQVSTLSLSLSLLLFFFLMVLNRVLLKMKKLYIFGNITRLQEQLHRVQGCHLRER